MIKSTFAWMQPANAPADDLQVQLEAARQAHQQARGEVAAALDQFDRLADEAATRRLDAANAAEALARQHAARAERLVAAAAAQQTAAARADDQRKVERLQSALAAVAVEQRRRPLAEREADLLEQLVEVRAQRFDLELAINADQRALDQLREKLGGVVAYVPMTPTHASASVAIDRLEKIMRSSGADDVRKRICSSLILEAAPGYFRRPIASAAE